MNVIVENIPYAKTVQDFVLWITQYYAINPDSISVYGEDVMDVSGLCIDRSETEFDILVRVSDKDIGQIFNTIAHEMIHVKQYINENLGYHMDNCKDIPYMNRWWEVEAFSDSVSLVEQFVKLLKNK